MLHLQPGSNATQILTPFLIRYQRPAHTMCGFQGSVNLYFGENKKPLCLANTSISNNPTIPPPFFYYTFCFMMLS